MSDFLEFVRKRQLEEQGQAQEMVEKAEALLEEEKDRELEEMVEKAAPWVESTQEKGWGKAGPGGVAVYKHKNGFWVTKGDAVAGWVEKRGRKWLARPVGRDEWTGDSFKKAVSHVAGAFPKGDTSPPPGTK